MVARSPEPSRWRRLRRLSTRSWVRRNRLQSSWADVVLEESLNLLLLGQNPDGGWGAVAGKRSNTEATALALLALQAVLRKTIEPAAEKAKTWLAERQNVDGSWPLSDTLKGSSWSTALAIIALSPAGDVFKDRVIKAGNWTLEQE